MLIPATILTGFLGAGKTTLLKRVLTEAHGQKIAIIENEFGEENIDNEILVSDTNEQIIQMNNGCVCCTIREDLRTTLQLLAAKKRKGLLDFERVVIETTGLADPGPVAQTFFMDDEIAESFLLDSILTLVDAKHAAQQLNDRQEARRQVGFADQIFISKSDLVSAEELDALQHRLKHMNPRAPQKVVHFGEVSLAEVFDLRGFNLNAKLDIDDGAQEVFQLGGIKGTLGFENKAFDVIVMVVVMARPVLSSVGVIAVMCMIAVGMVVMPMVVPMRIMSMFVRRMVTMLAIVVMVAIVCQKVWVNV